MLGRTLVTKDTIVTNLTVGFFFLPLVFLSPMRGKREAQQCAKNAMMEDPQSSMEIHKKGIWPSPEP